MCYREVIAMTAYKTQHLQSEHRPLEKVIISME